MRIIGQFFFCYFTIVSSFAHPKKNCVEFLKNSRHIKIISKLIEYSADTQIQFLGSGSVYKVVSTQMPQPIAIKIYDEEHDAWSDSKTLQYLHSVTQSNDGVQVIRQVFSRKRNILFLEYIDGVTLFDFLGDPSISKERKFKVLEIYHFFIQTLFGRLNKIFGPDIHLTAHKEIEEHEFQNDLKWQSSQLSESLWPKLGRMMINPRPKNILVRRSDETL